MIFEFLIQQSTPELQIDVFDGRLSLLYGSFPISSGERLIYFVGKLREDQGKTGKLHSTNFRSWIQDCQMTVQ